MANVPPEIRRAVEQANQLYPNDIDRAAAEAEELAKDHPEFALWVDGLVKNAIRKLVWDDRHIYNRRLDANAEGHPSVGPARLGGSSESLEESSAAVAEMFEVDFYQMKVGGRTLGSLRLSELPALAEDLVAKANGYLIKAELLKWISASTRNADEDLEVREAIPSERIRKQYLKIRRKYRDS